MGERKQQSLLVECKLDDTRVWGVCKYRSFGQGIWPEEPEYTKEEEEFAKEVRKWLNEYVPKDMAHTRDPLKAQSKQQRELYRKLAEKGWLAPGFPSQYGGGGLG